MQAILTGKFMEGGSRTNQKTGEVIPYAMIYSGKEVVQVMNADLTEMEFGGEVQIPVTISVGNYGLFIRAVVDDDQRG